MSYFARSSEEIVKDSDSTVEEPDESTNSTLPDMVSSVLFSTISWDSSELAEHPDSKPIPIADKATIFLFVTSILASWRVWVFVLGTWH